MRPKIPRMDNWNPILAEQADYAVDRHAEIRDRVSATLIGVLIGVGLVGWLLLSL